MKVEISDKLDISFGFIELLECISLEQKQGIASALGCDEHIFKAITDQIIKGFTEDGSHTYSNLIDQVREDFIQSRDDIFSRVMETLLKRVKQAEMEQQRNSDWAWEMFSKWPDDQWQTRPRIPEWMPANVSKDEVESEIAKATKGES